MSNHRTDDGRSGWLHVCTSPEDNNQLSPERSHWEEELEQSGRPKTPSHCPSHSAPLIPEPSGGASLRPHSSPPPTPRIEVSPPGDAPVQRAAPSWAISATEADERARMGREAASWRPPRHLRPNALGLTAEAVQGSASGAMQYFRGRITGRKSRSQKKKTITNDETDPEALEEGWSDDEQELEDDWEDLDDDCLQLPSEHPWPGQTDWEDVMSRIREQIAVGGAKIIAVSKYEEIAEAVSSEIANLSGRLSPNSKKPASR